MREDGTRTVNGYKKSRTTNGKPSIILANPLLAAVYF